MYKVLIVGAGPTGALIANGLRRELQQKVAIVMWDKSKGTGGRMSTSRSPTDGKCIADLGAQYISVLPDYATKHAGYYKDLLDSGLIKSLAGKIEGMKENYFNPDTKNYVTPSGISSIVKHYLKKSGAVVNFDHHLSRVEVDNTTSADHPRLAAFTADSSTEGAFDAVVLTMPVPQILQQEGLTRQSLEENSPLRQKLEEVQYSSRYALALFYPPGVSIDLPFVGKYVEGNPCIRWVSLDNKKRGADESIGPSLVVHTSVPFGIKHLEEAKENIQPIILQHLKAVVPNLPEPASIKCQKWRYSQVSKPMEGAPGHVTISEQQSYLLLAAGDGFSHSNFDGCIESAESTLSKLLEFFQKSSQL